MPPVINYSILSTFVLMDVHAVGHNYSQLVAIVLVDYFVFYIFFI